MSCWDSRASGKARVGRRSRFRPPVTVFNQGPRYRPPPFCWGLHPQPQPTRRSGTPPGPISFTEARDLGKQKRRRELNPSPCAPLSLCPPHSRDLGGMENKRGLTPRIKTAPFPASSYPFPFVLNVFYYCQELPKSRGLASCDSHPSHRSQAVTHSRDTGGQEWGLWSPTPGFTSRLVA